jgi:hypothetical protein
LAGVTGSVDRGFKINDVAVRVAVLRAAEKLWVAS